MRQSWSEEKKSREPKQDLEVKLLESEVRSLRRSANLGPIALVLVVLLAGLFGVGYYLDNQRETRTQAKVTAQHKALAAKEAHLETVVQNHSLRDAEHALKTKAVDKKMDAIAAQAHQAVVIANKVAADFEPVPEQLTADELKLMALSQTDDKLAAADSVQTANLAKLDSKVDANQAANKEANDTLLRNVDGLGRRVDLSEESVKKMQKHQLLTDIGNGLLHGITYFSRYGPNPSPNGKD